MSSTLSTNSEHRSDLSIWIVLFSSALALVVFFSWVMKDQSALGYPDSQNILPVPPLADARPAVDTALDSAVSANNEASAFELADSQSASQLAAERASHQQREAEHKATEQNLKPRPVVEKQQGTVQSNTKQFRTDQAHPVVSADIQLNTDLSAASRTEVSQDEPWDADGDKFWAKNWDKEGDRDWYVAQRTDALTPESARLVATQQELVSLQTLSDPQLPAADLGDLRQLLAEAATINSKDDEQALSERERREALESLANLSAAIHFTVGSKLVSEKMDSVLFQMERILSDFPETSISVLVATNESGENKRDLLLSQERGRALIARLVKGGLAFSRFSLEAVSDEQLPASSHRVEIQARSES